MEKPFQVLLIQPRVEDFYATPCRTQPLGLGYLAAALRKYANADVHIFDAMAGGKKRSIPWPKDFKYLQRYYGYPDSGPFSLFHQYFRFGKTDEEILEWLKSKKPSLIGISALFTPYYQESLKMARLCKRMFPNVPVVMGGNHATVCPESLFFPSDEFSGSNLCDYIISGEGEAGMCGLVSFLKGRCAIDSVHNLIIKEGDDIHHTNPKTPSELSLSECHPEFPGLKPSDYTYNKHPMRCMQTSRGCRFRCTFCTVHHIFGKGVVRRPIEDVLCELKAAYEAGIRHFDFEDDDLTGDTAYAFALFDKIREQQFEATFSAMNGIHYATLDEAVCRVMKAIGFEAVNVSLVTTEKKIHRSVNRPYFAECFEKSVAACNRSGLNVIAYVILGMPGQTLENMFEAVRLLSGLQCLMGPSPYYCTPGTDLYKMAHKDVSVRFASRAADELFSARLTALDMECDAFNRDDIYTLFRFCRLINYVKAGLDKGLELKSAYFNPVLSVWETGTWWADSKKGRYSLPLSSEVFRMFKAAPFLVTGYKTDRCMSLL